MNTEEKITRFREWKKKCAAYQMVLSTTHFDKETIAPEMGSAYRNEKLSIMSGEAYKVECDKEIIQIIEELSKEDLGEEMNREIYLNKKMLESVSKFSEEETVAFDKLCLDGWDAWYQGKKNNDYAVFEPYLKKLFAAVKERALRRAPDKDPYDTCLDDFEENMTRAKYDEFFNLIKEELIPLIRQVNAKQEAIDDSFLHLHYPIEKQKEFGKILNRYMGFEKWGYMGESEHPFTNGISRNDVRITTRYDQDNITFAIFSTIHETGHAYYEHNIDARYDDMSIRTAISSGMHESQSRFLENYIGRSEAFWKTLYPKLQELFPENLGNITLEQFVRAINKAGSSLIRTEADELTYPLHILIRYEIEKGVFEGSIPTDHLNEVWKEKYKEYLGIDVPSETEGILQDVHWSQASFGYFPTYALGSAIGAQLFDTIRKQIDIDKLLAENRFAELEEYLREHVHYDAALHDYNYIVKRATGREFDPHCYTDYLKEKYKKLYQID